MQFRSNKRRRTTKVVFRRAQDNKVQFRSQKRRRTTKVEFGRAENNKVEFSFKMQ